MEAAFRRNIRDGKEFDSFFPKPKGTEVTEIKGNASVEDTVELIIKMVVECKDDTKKIAPILQGKSLYETLLRDWSFVYWHMQYKKDKHLVEQLRRPSRAWADRKSGVDCDCYTIFLSTLLDNQGINHVLRVTKYAGHKNFSHIYIIVPIDGNVNNVDKKGNYYTIDCVPDSFNYEAPNVIDKMDIKRNVSGLDGLGILRETIVTEIKPLPEFPRVIDNSANAGNTNLTDDGFKKGYIAPDLNPIPRQTSPKESLWWLAGLAGAVAATTIAAGLSDPKKNVKIKI